MKIYAYHHDGHRLAIEWNGDSARSTPYRNLAELSAAIEDDTLTLGDAVDVSIHPPSPVTVGARAMLFAGINYRDHIMEVPGASIPSEPFFFSKLPSTLSACGDIIRIPSLDIGCDYEVELAAVIGRTTRSVSVDEAGATILGFTVVNDLSARQIQFADSQITLGKNLDGFCPTASVLVTPDEINHRSLTLISRVNGEQRQHACTADMVFTVDELISRLSARITLHPGDVVSTGTPAGVGWFRNPRAYLGDGDTVEVEVEDVGRVETTIVLGLE